jgi:uncharacterized protein (DUF2141 family)
MTDIDEHPRASLRVVVHGFKHERGQAVARLYRPDQNVLSRDPFRRVTAPIRGAEAVCEFPSLSPGWYALVAFHDETGGGQINHKLGFPVEPLGFSNGFRLSLASGRPTFEKLKFEVKGVEEIAVVVR